MQIGQTFHITNRSSWRKWLEKNHDSAPDIWLVFYKKSSNKPSIPYDHAVEEALCFGWIDSIIKKMDDERRAQRFSPRNPKSDLSELNKERIRRMMSTGKMKQSGLDRIEKHLSYKENGSPYLKEFEIPTDILNELKKDPVVWENFNNFPNYYKNIRCGFIEGARIRPEEFRKRLDYFIKMTAQNKRYGSIK